MGVKSQSVVFCFWGGVCEALLEDRLGERVAELIVRSLRRRRNLCFSRRDQRYGSNSLEDLLRSGLHRWHSGDHVTCFEGHPVLCVGLKLSQ